MIKLSKRLQTIASFVEDNWSIVDIGCDHALVDIYLCLNRKNIQIIASDINKNALDNAYQNICKYQLNDRINLCLSDGLSNISSYVNTLLISGMGGHNIIDILTKAKDRLGKVNNLIIQSNNDLPFVRREIVKLGYYIKDEELVLEKNIYYTIILFVKGKKKYSKKEYFLGPILIKKQSELFKKKKQEDYNKLLSIRNNLPKSKLFLRLKLSFELLMYI